MRTFPLTGNGESAAPTGCEGVETFDFAFAARRIAVVPRTWIPGSEHPFRPHMLRAATQGQWVCADGFKWTKPGEECIAASIGLVGLTIERIDESVYPRVQQVTDYSSAAQAGIAAGTSILSVDGQSTVGVSVSDVVDRIRGSRYRSPPRCQRGRGRTGQSGDSSASLNRTCVRQDKRQEGYVNAYDCSDPCFAHAP